MLLSKLNHIATTIDRSYYLSSSQFIAACLIMSVFILGGVNKLSSYSSTKQLIQTKLIFPKLPSLFSHIATYSTIIIEFILPLIVLGVLYMLLIKKNSVKPLWKKIAKVSIFIMLWFTIMISLVFHNPTIPEQRTSFLKNMGLVGGFIYIYNKL